MTDESVTGYDLLMLLGLMVFEEEGLTDESLAGVLAKARGSMDDDEYRVFQEEVRDFLGRPV